MAEQKLQVHNSQMGHLAISDDDSKSGGEKGSVSPKGGWPIVGGSEWNGKKGRVSPKGGWPDGTDSDSRDRK